VKQLPKEEIEQGQYSLQLMMYSPPFVRDNEMSMAAGTYSVDSIIRTETTCNQSKNRG
jgi:hypothetical protein